MEMARSSTETARSPFDSLDGETLEELLATLRRRGEEEERGRGEHLELLTFTLRETHEDRKGTDIILWQ